MNIEQGTFNKEHRTFNIERLVRLGQAVESTNHPFRYASMGLNPGALINIPSSVERSRIGDFVPIIGTASDPACLPALARLGFSWLRSFPWQATQISPLHCALPNSRDRSISVEMTRSGEMPADNLKKRLRSCHPEWLVKFHARDVEHEGSHRLKQLDFSTLETPRVTQLTLP